MRCFTISCGLLTRTQNADEGMTIEKKEASVCHGSLCVDTHFENGVNIMAQLPQRWKIGKCRTDRFCGGTTLLVVSLSNALWSMSATLFEDGGISTPTSDSRTLWRGATEKGRGREGQERCLWFSRLCWVDNGLDGLEGLSGFAGLHFGGVVVLKAPVARIRLCGRSPATCVSTWRLPGLLRAAPTCLWCSPRQVLRLRFLLATKSSM